MDENRMQEQAKRAKIWNITIISFFVTIVIVFLAYCGIYKYQHTFTVEKWAKEPDDRRKIVADLLERHKLVGMTEEEVVSLLGEEESYANTKASFKISKTYFEPENTIVYYLGVDYMDDMWLIISLDNGIVSSYCIDIT
ncbi:MAG: hypothetical protein GX489_00345 [Firmicutes bacterium]|nr:hypothetical protein [Bacillota bacterium]